MKKIMYAVLASVLASVNASAVTATKEYVDRQDGATLQAANEYTDTHGGGVNTNTVRAIVGPMIDAATNAIRRVDGAARPLPAYLHALDFSDSYTNEAARYYETASVPGGNCSARRIGGFVERNYDWYFDRSAEFVVRMSAGPDRFASVGVASCGTNLSEEVVTSGKPSRFYKCLPGMTLDGINENGVVAEMNVCTTNGMERWNDEGTVHVLGAVRWALDHATNAQHAAEYLAANVKRPARMNFHYMIADATSTYIVENGTATPTNGVPVMTNHGLFPPVYGGGMERDAVLASGSITNAWWTNAYRIDADWVSDFESEDQMLAAQAAWNAPGKTKEDFRGAGGWWQTVHTSVYDITNRVLRVAVQEQDDWYTFAVDQANVDLTPIESQIASLQEGKRDKTDLACYVHADDAWVFDPPLPEGIYVRWIDDEPEWTGWELFDGVDGHSIPSGTRDAKDVYWSDQDIYEGVTIHGRHYVNELMQTGDHLATESGVAAAIAEHHDSTKRDLEDNTCHKTELGEWSHSPVSFPDGYSLKGQPYYAEIEEFWFWDVNGSDHIWYLADGYPDDTNLHFYTESDILPPDFTATRSAACTDGKKFVTSDVVDGKVSDAVSTNNPAFVSAVRNTPAPEPGQGEDPPWGTWGTLGAAIAGLVSGLAWLKNKIGVIFDNEGEIQDDFATDLLGKPVAISSMHYALNSGATIQDRAINLVTMTDTRQTITLPSRIVGKTRDLILRVEVGDLATIGGIALALGSTELASWEGDALDFKANTNYLVTVTETKNTAATDTQDAPTFFVRVVEMTAQPTAA